MSRPSPGVTFIEVILVAFFSSVILVALLRLMAAGYPLSRLVFMQASSTESARVHLKRLSKSLRELRVSDTGAYPLAAAQPQKIVFYSDVDQDGLTERIRYELEGTDLKRGVIVPGGDPLVYDENTEEVSTAVGAVRNGATPIFIYYSGDYPADSEPLSSSDVTEVKYLQFRLIIDVDPNQEPDPVEVMSQVQLRNLKTNLGEVIEE